jgi:hypothetical protein
VINTVKLGARLPFTCQTIADFFFADETGTLPDSVNFKEADMIHNDYVSCMAAVHQKLQSQYNRFVKVLLSE